MRPRHSWTSLALGAVALLTAVALLAGSAPPGKAPSAVVAAGAGSRAGQPSPDCLLDPAGLPPMGGPDGQPTNYLHTCGNRILDSRGREVRIAGVSWSGMEHGDRAPGGLSHRNWQSILDQIAALGYNTVRIPYSDDALTMDRPVGNVDFALNPDLQGLNGLEVMDRLVAGARDRGLRVILDRHYVSSGNLTTLWYTRDAPPERWIANLRLIAARYRGNDTVIGIDLANEPHGEATWGTGDPATDWRLAAETAGNAVLDANPYLLVFVQGVETYQWDQYWWGGNLQGVRTAPVRLNVPNRVVYSPHDYGPAVSWQSWFGNPFFPANLPYVWDRNWGYIHESGLAPVVVGEFGGRSLGDDRDGLWQRALVTYLAERRIGAIVWSLGPNWDTGGILGDDWRTANPAKEQAYRELAAAPIAVGALGVFGLAPNRYLVLLRQQPADDGTGTVAFSFQIVDAGPRPVELSRLELRYWLADGGQAEGGQEVQVEAPGGLSAHVRADFAPTHQGGQTRYLRLRFDPTAGSIAGYRATEPIVVRFHRSGPPGQGPSADYSYSGSAGQPEAPREWDRVTLYLDGRLVFGREP